MKVALAQFNPVVGDIAGNVARIAETIGRAAREGADLVVFGELSVLGYPPRDLLRKERFVAESAAAVEELAAGCTRTAAVVGFVRPAPAPAGRPLQNAAALLAGGKVRDVYVKALLPTYDVFDETRYFQPGSDELVFELAGRCVGLTICEDLWDAESLGRRLYDDDPVERLARRRCDLIVNMAASPYETGKARRRESLIRRQAARSGAAVVFVNQVGGNDELVFDGGSCAFAADGRLLGRAKSFDEDLLIVEPWGGPARCEGLGEPMARLAGAIRVGIRDYVRKCGFGQVVLGLSGGIDSAVVAALAADALGPDNVCALLMPSRHSSDHSAADAQALAGSLGIQSRLIPIEPMHAAFEEALGESLRGPAGELAAENVQARIRGMLVMAWSNAHGHLPLATGNKSELSVGYCTLYGDMCGGLAPIGDLLKTVVYRLAEHLNAAAGRERICRRILTKPPSAELKPGQVDQDKLPPYDVLDAILARYIEADATAEQIIAEGEASNRDTSRLEPRLDADTVRRVASMVDLAEFKRKQAAPVLKLTRRAFGIGRRMPIAQRYVPAPDL